MLYPLKFLPVYKSYLWGGERISEVFGKTDTPEICAESWEISANPDGMGIVANGKLSGKSLAELTLEYGRRLLGTKAKDEKRFPLLTKIIDARESLSVQIHPSQADSSANPNDYKNECWYILDSTDKAHIFAGFLDGMTREDLTKAAKSGETDKVLRIFSPHKHETLFIPSGLVHAIGAGCLIYEVQQNSNVTYRFYDWGRVDKNGKGRELHLEAGLRSVDLSLAPPAMEPPRARLASPFSVCTATPYFRLLRAEGCEPLALDTMGESFHILFVESGSYDVAFGEFVLSAKSGESLLIPAECQKYTLTPSGNSSILLAHL